MMFVAGVPTATTTASALRVRVGRLLDPRRDRSARLASATSLVSVTALALAVVVSTQLAPAVMFLEAVAVTPPAAAAPAIDMRRAPASRTKVNATAVGAEAAATPHVHAGDASGTLRPAGSGQFTHSRARTKRWTSLRRCHSTAASLRRTSARPCSQYRCSPRHGLASLRRHRLSRLPGTSVSASTTSAASGVARAAVATAAHARSAGVSIGRFFTRAGKAVAKDFQSQ